MLLGCTPLRLMWRKRVRSVPRVAIVMPTFNSARHLKSTVESVVAQTFSEWELVLFDDGSTDDTISLSKELAAHDERIHTATGAHLGPAVARNEGLRRTNPQSEFVIFLDSDDTWVPEALAELVSALEENPHCVVAHGLARATDMDGHQLEGDDLADNMRRRRELHGDELVVLPASANTTFGALLVENCVVTPGTSLIRRSTLELVGDLDPTTSPGDDWDLNVRLARAGDFAFLDRTVLNWRRHPDALSNTNGRMRRVYVVVRRRSIQSSENTPDQRAAAFAMLRRDCRLSRRAIKEKLRRRRLSSAAKDAGYAFMLHVEYIRCRLVTR